MMTAQGHCESAKHNAVILLIPILDSRDFIIEALESIGSNVHLFDRVILSVNGNSSRKVQKLAERLSLHEKTKINILCTGRPLTARRHSRFIQQQLCRLASSTSLVYLHADDDLFAPKADLAGYISQVLCAGGSCVGMGNFKSFSASPKFNNDEQQHVKPGEEIEPLRFLVRNQAGHLYTNITSMLIPLQVFNEASFFMWLLGSAGRRTEYIFATHKSVKSLYSPPNYSAFIRHHPEQEGRTLSHESYLHDELVYIVWVWFNQPATRPWAGQSIFCEFRATRFWSLLRQLILIKLKRRARSIHALLKRSKELCRKPSIR